ncbi:MAG: 30S ribosomal protein S6 [Candidatus Aminicenantia bacterium]
MRKYETGFILSPALSEEEIREFLSGIRKFIEEAKGSIIQEEHWGRKNLAYKIGKFNEGNYYFFFYEGDPFIPKELERRFKQSEKVLRFLTVKMDDYLKKMEKIMSKKERKGEKKKGSSKEEEISTVNFGKEEVNE